MRYAAEKAKFTSTKVMSVRRFKLIATVLDQRCARKVPELLEIPFKNCTL